MSSLSDADYRTLALFRRALRQFLAFSEQAARASGLTPSQHQLLLAIRGAPAPPPSIGEVADALRMRHHSAVGLVDRAQAAGLVARVPDKTDGRRQRLRLTPAGQRVLDRLSRQHREELGRFRAEMLDVLKELEPASLG